MRSELVIPFQLAAVGVHGQDAFGEEIIAGPVGVIVIGVRSGGWPIQSVGLRVMRARHPRAASPKRRFFALPRLNARLALECSSEHRRSLVACKIARYTSRVLPGRQVWPCELCKCPDRGILLQEMEASMVACVDCHRLRKALVSCALSHNIGH